MATQQQPPNTGFALIAFAISAALLGYSALHTNEQKQQAAAAAVAEPVPVEAEVRAAEEVAPPFTPSERDATLQHLNLRLMPIATRADFFTQQTETFPVQISDLTAEGNAIWNGPYLELPIEDPHPVSLLWGSNPVAAGMSACGLEPAFNLDCFLWMSVENYPMGWFRVLDTQYDDGDGELAGHVRYDDKARSLVIEYRTLMVQPEAPEVVDETALATPAE